MTNITFTTTHAEAYNAFKVVSFAMCKEEARYYLNGALLEYDGEDLELTATDGYRLHSLPLSWDFDKETPEFKHIIPATFIRHFTKRKPTREEGCIETTIIINDDTIQLKNATMDFKSVFIDGTYPDYKRVVPIYAKKDKIHTVTLHTAYLAEIGKAVKLMDSKDHVTLQLSTDPDAPILIKDGQNGTYVMMSTQS